MTDLINKADPLTMKIDELPFYHKAAAQNGATLILPGEVVKIGNTKAYVEENQCSGRICRVLCPDKTFTSALVIRDDGTVWKIQLNLFESWQEIEISRTRRKVG